MIRELMALAVLVGFVANILVWCRYWEGRHDGNVRQGICKYAAEQNKAYRQK